MTNDPTTEGGALIGVEVVTAQLAASHATDGMNEVAAEEIFEPVLIRVVGVGTQVKVVRRRVHSAFLVTCILGSSSVHVLRRSQRTYAVTLLVEHEGGNGPSGVGADPSLTADTDSGSASAVLILCAGDGASRHGHGRISGGSMEMEITEVVDGGNDQPMVFLISLPS